MEIKISNIKVKKRIREEIGDIKPLMESMAKFGQFHPITVTQDMELITGFRRLSSATELGWEYIDAEVVHVKDKLEFLQRELDENLLRKDFTPDEITTGYERLKKLQNPGLFKRFINYMTNLFKKLFRKSK